MARKKTGTSFQDLVTAFRNGNVKPLYFLYGDEGFLIDEVQRVAVEALLEPHEHDFNLDVIFGPEADARDVLAQCASYPMMASRRVVIVRGFERLDGNDRFKAYAEQPNPNAVVLLLCTDKPNVSAHPYRALRENAVWSNFEPLRDREVPGWIERRFKGAGVQTESGAAQMLSEIAASDLRTLASEVEKLVTYVGSRRRVTRNDVLQATGHSREINPFELQKAIGAGETARALAIANGLLGQAANRVGEAHKTVAILTSYVTKIWKLSGCQGKGLSKGKMARQVGVPPFYLDEYLAVVRRWSAADVRRALEALLAADTELKGGSQRDERLVLTLLVHRLTASPVDNQSSAAAVV